MVFNKEVIQVLYAEQIPADSSPTQHDI